MLMKQSKKKSIKSFFFLVSIFFVLSFFYYFKVQAAPLTANYYLGELKSEAGFLSQLARYDLLILTQDQINTHLGIIKTIRQNNPDVIILTYVPSQSFNTKYWDNYYSVFKNLRPIDESWWLRDPQGKIIHHWQDLANINMDQAWSRHLVAFVQAQILNNSEIDGVFFDMVSESISWANGGDIDLNGDGQKDDQTWLDKEWLARTAYFLEYARDNLKTKYIVMNGSSHPILQQFVNGRMFETFPIRRDNNGEWGKIMNSWKKNKQQNSRPFLTIINANTSNSGRVDYQNMRFGLASTLLENGYFSYDYGDQEHGQTWWYDEYDVNLGEPLSSSKSKNNYSEYKADIWQRDFANGLAIVNSTGEKKTVGLGGEYEKIHGAQDVKVNDGSIITETSIDGYDGLLLLKTFASVQDVLFRNGDFLRFFDGAGNRVRNGFFVFESGYKGGDKIARVDLDGNGQRDLLVVSKNKILAWRDDGQIFMWLYPYTVNYQGELRVAAGDLNKDGYLEVYVAPSPGYPLPIKIYTRHGRQMKRDWYPFGENYFGGYSLAVGNVSNGDKNDLVVAKASSEPLVSIFDYNYNLAYQWLAFDKRAGYGVNVAAGNVDGLGAEEIIAGAGKGGKPMIRIFDKQGKQIGSEFTAYGALDKPGIEVLTADVDYDGKNEIIGMSSGF